MNNRRTICSNSTLVLGSLLVACGNVGNEPRTFASDTSTGGSTNQTSAGGSSTAGASSIGGSNTGGTSSTGVKATGGTSSPAGLGGNATGGVPYVPPSSSISLPYTDDFEDGNLDGWLQMDNSSSALGSWSIGTDGATNHILQQVNSGSSATWQVGGDVKWTDQKYSVRVKWADTSTYIYVGLRFNYSDGYYYLQTVPGSKPKIRVRNNGSTNDVCAGTTNFAGAAGTWYTITVTAQGSTFSAAIDGTPVCSASNTTFANGGIAVGTDGGPAAFDDVNVIAP